MPETTFQQNPLYCKDDEYKPYELYNFMYFWTFLHLCMSLPVILLKSLISRTGQQRLVKRNNRNVYLQVLFNTSLYEKGFSRDTQKASFVIFFITCMDRYKVF